MRSISRNGAIAERTLSKEEQYLKSLDYEKDEKEIWNLSSRQFRMWLYGLDPTDAILLGGYHSFNILCEIKRDKWKFFWRIFWE